MLLFKGFIWLSMIQLFGHQKLLINYYLNFSTCTVFYHRLLQDHQSVQEEENL